MKKLKSLSENRNWHLLDAKNQILGRLSSDVVHLLMGKNKSNFSPNLDTGDFVVVVNAQSVKLSGKKENQKKYYHHSGYPGGLKVKTAAQIRQGKPEELIRHSVTGMLPRTKLGRQMLKKLYVFPGSENPYEDKFKKN